MPHAHPLTAAEVRRTAAHSTTRRGRRSCGGRARGGWCRRTSGRTGSCARRGRPRGGPPPPRAGGAARRRVGGWGRSAGGGPSDGGGGGRRRGRHVVRRDAPGG